MRHLPEIVEVAPEAPDPTPSRLSRCERVLRASGDPLALRLGYCRHDVNGEFVRLRHVGGNEASPTASLQATSKK